MKLTPMKLLLILLLFGFSVAGYSQSSLTEIDYSRIPQRKIRHFIDSQIDDHKVNFSDIEPSYDLNNEESDEDYNLVEDIFIFKERLEKVWNSYCSTEMAESWNGKKISFGLLLSKWNEFIMYCSDHNNTAALDTGQVFFVNLKLLHGIYNLAVGFEVVNIDTKDKTIQFSYIKGGKSEGVQTIHFTETEDGNTKIVHTSEFRSSSNFRDKRLYPRFHKKFIYEFHENMLISLGKTKDDIAFL
jgi:hypothetical protein